MPIALPRTPPPIATPVRTMHQHRMLALTAPAHCCPDIDSCFPGETNPIPSESVSHASTIVPAGFAIVALRLPPI